MDKLSCDLPLNGKEKGTEGAPTHNSRREFLRAAAASSGVAILSAQFVPDVPDVAQGKAVYRARRVVD